MEKVNAIEYMQEKDTLTDYIFDRTVGDFYCPAKYSLTNYYEECCDHDCIACWEYALTKDYIITKEKNK